MDVAERDLRHIAENGDVASGKHELGTDTGDATHEARRFGKAEQIGRAHV